SGIQQFGIWAWNTVRFNFGKSFVTRAPALDGLRRGLPVTVELVLFAWLLSIVLGISLGVISAVMRGGPVDYTARLVGIVGLSVPDFLAATFFILGASLYFHWSAPPGYRGIFTAPG